MSKQKEDVLLMVKHVRYKKVDGTLYVNSGRVAWRNQTSDTFKISAAFEDIRVQRISPDQKEKVQLQLLMHNGDSFTFQFADPTGRQKQLEMRNNVKEMLQGLLPKFKDKAQSELKEKFRLLESNPEILALYKELVVTGILSSEEFWARPEFTGVTPKSSTSETNVAPQRKSDSRSTSTVTPGTTNHVNTTDGSSTLGQISRSFNLVDKPQALGVPSYLLSDIKPEADGANGIKYNLTHDIIDAIFRAYPMVRQRHRELVPDKLSEADFWVKFFQSHYFHRDRVQIPKEDIFAECAALDERHFQNELRRSRRSRISACLDLDSLSDHDIGCGYGLASGETKGTNASFSSDVSKSTEANKTSSAQSGNLSANQLLLRRFNNHSILVLKSLATGDIASGLSSNTSSTDVSGNSGTSQDPSMSSLKDRVYGPELAEDPEQHHYPLELTNVNDYLEGPVSIAPSTTVPSSSTTLPPKQASAISVSQLTQGLKRCQASVAAAYQAKRKPQASMITAVEAQLALADVSPGGFLVGGKSVTDDLKASGTNRSDPPSSSRTSTSKQAESRTNSSGSDVDRSPALLNSEQLRDLSLLYASASELLRHFWACFPVTSQQLAEKLERIAISLNRFRATKVAHFAASVDSSLSGKSDSSLSAHNSNASLTNLNRGTVSIQSYGSRVTGHLESMLDAAQSKYTEWCARRKR